MTDFEKITQVLKDVGITFILGKKKDYISLSQKQYDKNFEHIEKGDIMPKSRCDFECNFYFDDSGRCIDCDIS